MGEPVSTVSAFIGSKLTGLLWSLGAALATLSFTDENKLLRGVFNLMATWFVGFVLGEAINAELQRPHWQGMVFVISTTMGLLLIGGLYKMASAFRNNPEDFLKRWWKFWRKP